MKKTQKPILVLTLLTLGSLAYTVTQTHAAYPLLAFLRPGAQCANDFSQKPKTIKEDIDSLTQALNSGLKEGLVKELRSQNKALKDFLFQRARNQIDFMKKLQESGALTRGDIADLFMRVANEHSWYSRHSGYTSRDMQSLKQFNELDFDCSQDLSFDQISELVGSAAKNEKVDELKYIFEVFKIDPQLVNLAQAVSAMPLIEGVVSGTTRVQATGLFTDARGAQDRVLDPSNRMNVITRKVRELIAYGVPVEGTMTWKIGSSIVMQSRTFELNIADMIQVFIAEAKYDSMSARKKDEFEDLKSNGASAEDLYKFIQSHGSIPTEKHWNAFLAEIKIRPELSSKEWMQIVSSERNLGLTQRMRAQGQ